MKDLAYEIKPKEGLGEIRFGDDYARMTDLLGEPEDSEHLNDEEEFPTIVLNYWDKRLTVFLEGIEKQVISCFEIENDKASLFGHWAFNLKEAEVIALMQENGYSVLDTDWEEWGDRRVTFEDGMIDFFFDKEGKLISVNWGVLVNDKGEIEDF